MSKWWGEKGAERVKKTLNLNSAYAVTLRKIAGGKLSLKQSGVWTTASHENEGKAGKRHVVFEKIRACAKKYTEPHSLP